MGDGLTEAGPPQTRKWPPRFRQWLCVVMQAQGTGWDGGGWGKGLRATASFRSSLLPRQLSAQSQLSRGSGLDKGWAGVPAGARGLCIQVLAPRSKARPCAGPRLTSALQLHSFEAAQALTLCKPELDPREGVGILRGLCFSGPVPTPNICRITLTPAGGSRPPQKAGDALIYIHLHLMHSNTPAAQGNSVDSKPRPLALPK